MKTELTVKQKNELADHAEALKAISDVNRLAILKMLGKGERCVCEIWPDLGLPQNLASHHLRVLKEAGLIRFRKEGLRVFYSLDKPHMKRVHAILNKIF